jgi:hypothetical protein
MVRCAPMFFAHMCLRNGPPDALTSSNDSPFGGKSPQERGCDR